MDELEISIEHCSKMNDCTLCTNENCSDWSLWQPDENEEDSELDIIFGR